MYRKSEISRKTCGSPSKHYTEAGCRDCLPCYGLVQGLPRMQRHLVVILFRAKKSRGAEPFDSCEGCMQEFKPQMTTGCSLCFCRQTLCEIFYGCAQRISLQANFSFKQNFLPNCFAISEIPARNHKHDCFTEQTCVDRTRNGVLTASQYWWITRAFI